MGAALRQRPQLPRGPRAIPSDADSRPSSLCMPRPRPCCTQHAICGAHAPLRVQAAEPLHLGQVAMRDP